jgi:hypothetical protein
MWRIRTARGSQAHFISFDLGVVGFSALASLTLMFWNRLNDVFRQLALKILLLHGPEAQVHVGCKPSSHCWHISGLAIGQNLGIPV